jgi:signal transduction histidine kinase
LDSPFDFIFRQAAEGILAANSEQVLVNLNPAAVSLLNLNPAASLQQPIQSLFRHNPKLIRLLTVGGPASLDIPLPNDRLAAGTGGDVLNGRLVILHDVTEQRDLDSRREALSRAIAHDLRNPLNAISGYANLVASLGDLNEQQKKFSQRIQQTTNKLYEMSAKLVDLAWIEAGMPLQYIPVELAGLTREVIRELATEAAHKQVSIINSIPDELPNVIGDPKRLKQTIYNILDNAIRYSHEGGNVMIHAWHQGEQVYYAIADQGIGIREDEQAKVWDRLWRSADERVRDIPGGGIGLCFAHIIIRRHGGDIQLESQLDHGTSVTFHLPLTRLSAKA